MMSHLVLSLQPIIHFKETSMSICLMLTNVLSFRQRVITGEPSICLDSWEQFLDPYFQWDQSHTESDRGSSLIFQFARRKSRINFSSRIPISAVWRPLSSNGPENLKSFKGTEEVNFDLWSVTDFSKYWCSEWHFESLGGRVSEVLTVEFSDPSVLLSLLQCPLYALFAFDLALSSANCWDLYFLSSLFFCESWHCWLEMISVQKEAYPYHIDEGLKH